MKKTMLALMATVGLAFGAKAVNSTGFEDYEGDFAYDKTDTGAAMGTRYWAVTNATPDLSGTALTAYDGESAKPGEMPWAFTNTVNNTYLKVDTNNEVLYRSVEELDSVLALNTKGAEIGDGLYFDANVQFTASDGEPTPAEGDKLIVWLSGDDEAGTTNLVVTAATGYNAYGARQGIANYTNNNTAVSVADNEWHRLTVAAANANDMTTFKVYVDGKLVTAEGVTDGNFKSLVGSGDNLNYNTLTAVGFQGTGAIDNLVWTTEDPFYVEPPTTVALAVDVTGEYSSLVYIVGESTTTNEVDGIAASIEAAVDDVVTFVLTVADGYTPAVTGYELQKGEEQVDEFSDVYYPYTFTATVTQAMIDGGLTLAINVTEDEEPTPSEDVKEIGPDGTGYIADETGETFTKTQVEEMVSVVAPNDGSLTPAAKAAYDGYFTKKATYNTETKKWEVTVTLDKTALEANVDTAVAEALEDVGAAKVTLPAGFYYMVESGTDVSISTKAYGTSTGAAIGITGLGKDAGFFKVSVGTATFEE